MGTVTEECLLMHTGIYTRSKTWKVASHGQGIPLESEWILHILVVFFTWHGVQNLLLMFIKLYIDFLLVAIGTGERE